jgi:PAT family beta-lactamase induction signal transducer AmpG
MLRLKQIFDLYVHPNLIAVFFLGIASGLPLALVFSTLSVWLAEVGVSKTAIGLFATITTPYALKFLWSPLVDQMPIPFFTKVLGRRRGWMVFSQICLALSIVALGLTSPQDNAWYTALFAFIVSIASATQDIVIDAYRVEILEEKQQGAGAAMIVFGYRVGMLISGAGALFLAHYIGWFVAYAAMAVIVGIGFITVMLTGEPDSVYSSISLSRLRGRGREGANSTQKNEFLKSPHPNPLPQGEGASVKYGINDWLANAVINPLTDFMSRSGAVTILLFILLYKFGDAFAGVMTNPFLVEMGFSKVEIATVVKTFGFAASMIGAFIGGILVHKWGMLKSLWVCGILQMLSNLMFLLQAQIGYNVELLSVVIAIENLSGGMGTTAFVAYISSLCNKNYTATQYALFSSLASVGRTWLSASSGWFVDILGWVEFFALSTIIAIPGLVMIILLQRLDKKNVAMQNNTITNRSSV